MRRRDWLCSVLGWDGGLPVLVAFSPALLRAILPGPDLGELIAVILVPILAALLRAHHGSRQIERRFGGRVALGRQLLFGGAIVTLLLFEGLVGVLHHARDAPRSAWLAAGLMYFAYLGLVVPALRPDRLLDPGPTAETSPGR